MSKVKFGLSDSDGSGEGTYAYQDSLAVDSDAMAACKVVSCV